MFNPGNIYSKKFEAEVRRKQERHRRSLKNMKSTLDTRKPPRQLPSARHIRVQRAKEQEYAVIEMENRKLLEKMTKYTKSTVDNKLDPFVKRQMKYSSHLKKVGRRLDQEKIAKENELILHRIQCATPAYDHLQWAEEARKHDEVLAYLCEFPVMEGAVVPKGTRAPSRGTLIQR